MNLDKAKTILGLNGTENEKEIKTKYRNLIRSVHPDNKENRESESGYTATEINAAYDFIIKNVISERKIARWDVFDDHFSKTSNYKSSKKHSKKGADFTSTNATKWNAPINPNAYTKRPIYHNVEDSTGEKIGTIEIDKGKYIWTIEEDFPLFLKSLYDTGKRLLSEVETKIGYEAEDSIKQEFLARLIYLLSGQYVDGLVSLNALTSKDKDSYKIQAMLEPEGGIFSLKEGTLLYPAGVVNHRLYLRRIDGQIVGYVSFHDDRLYYAVVPLFEQRRVSVKTTVKEWHAKSRSHGAYADIDLWLKLIESDETSVDSTSLIIEGLLNEWRKALYNCLHRDSFF